MAGTINIVDGSEVLVAVRDRCVEEWVWIDWKESTTKIVVSKIFAGIFALKYQKSSYRIILECWGGT